LTRGEFRHTRSAEIRDQEATAAAAILGVSARENLEMRDGFFVNDENTNWKSKMIANTDPKLSCVMLSMTAILIMKRK
jgi:LmbE family N-acetylglucosaminyl deacetylase